MHCAPPRDSCTQHDDQCRNTANHSPWNRCASGEGSGVTHDGTRACRLLACGRAASSSHSNWYTCDHSTAGLRGCGVGAGRAGWACTPVTPLLHRARRQACTRAFGESVPTIQQMSEASYRRHTKRRKSPTCDTQAGTRSNRRLRTQPAKKLSWQTHACTHKQAGAYVLPQNTSTSPSPWRTCRVRNTRRPPPGMDKQAWRTGSRQDNTLRRRRSHSARRFHTRRCRRCLNDLRFRRWTQCRPSRLPRSHLPSVVGPRQLKAQHCATTCNATSSVTPRANPPSTHSLTRPLPGYWERHACINNTSICQSTAWEGGQSSGWSGVFRHGHPVFGHVQGGSYRRANGGELGAGRGTVGTVGGRQLHDDHACVRAATHTARVEAVRVLTALAHFIKHTRRTASTMDVQNCLRWAVTHTTLVDDAGRTARACPIQRWHGGSRTGNTAAAIR